MATVPADPFGPFAKFLPSDPGVPSLQDALFGNPAQVERPAPTAAEAALARVVPAVPEVIRQPLTKPANTTEKLFGPFAGLLDPRDVAVAVDDAERGALDKFNADLKTGVGSVAQSLASTVLGGKLAAQQALPVDSPLRPLLDADIAGQVANQAKLRGTVAQIPQRPALQELGQAKDWSGVGEALLRDPAGVIAGGLGQSAPFIVPPIAATVAGGPVAGAATIFGLDLGAETGGALEEAIVERLRDQATNPQAVMALLQDPSFVQEALTKGATKGAVVGLFDALSMGLAGKTLFPAIRGARGVAANLAGQTGLDVGAGMMGEAGGQLASTGEIGQPGGVALEGLVEAPTRIPEVAAALLHARGQQAPLPGQAPGPEQPPTAEDPAAALAAMLAQAGVAPKAPAPAPAPAATPTPPPVAAPPPVPTPESAAPVGKPPGLPPQSVLPQEPAAAAPDPAPGVAPVEAPPQGAPTPQEPQRGPEPVAAQPVSEPPGAAQPAPAAPVPGRPVSAQAPAAGGRQTVSTARGTQVETQLEVVDLADLITSDDPRFDPNLQPRERGDRKASDAQVAEIAGRLDPARLGPSAEADRGAPIIGPDNLVESGNGRVMALRRAYAQVPERAAAYRQYVEQLTGQSTEGLKAPVLVRRRLTDVDRRQFVIEANESATADLSAGEQARVDAELLDDKLLEAFTGGELDSAANRDFIGGFLAKLPVGQRNRLLTPEGNVSVDGLRRIHQALLARAYGGNELANDTLLRLTESTDDNVRSLTGAMDELVGPWAKLRAEVAAGAVAPEFDISAQLVQAVETVSQLRAEKRNIEEFLQQGDLLGARDPIVDALIRAFHTPDLAKSLSKAKVTDILRFYIDEARKQVQAQDGLFGGADAATVSPRALIEGGRANVVKQEAPAGKQAGFGFGLPGARGVRPGDATGRPEAQRPEPDARGPEAGGQEQPAEEVAAGDWPKPNKDGTYDSQRAGVQHFAVELENEQGVAGIVILQTGPNRWAYGYDWYSQGHTIEAPLVDRPTVPTRKEAILQATEFLLTEADTALEKAKTPEERAAVVKAREKIRSSAFNETGEQPGAGRTPEELGPGDAITTRRSKRLYICACGASKNDATRLLDAEDRYTGANFSTLHTLPRDHRPDVLILSARYGFIGHDTLIPNYDEKMTAEKANDFMEDETQVDRFRATLAGHDDVLVVGGGEYARVFNDLLAAAEEDGLLEGITVTRAKGGIGEQKAQIKAWMTAPEGPAEGAPAPETQGAAAEAPRVETPPAAPAKDEIPTLDQFRESIGDNATRLNGAYATLAYNFWKLRDPKTGDQFTIAQLQAAAKFAGVPSSGTKSQLLNRLRTRAEARERIRVSTVANLNVSSLPELRKLATDAGFSKAGNMNKRDLLPALQPWLEESRKALTAKLLGEKYIAEVNRLLTRRAEQGRPLTPEELERIHAGGALDAKLREGLRTFLLQLGIYPAEVVAQEDQAAAARQAAKDTKAPPVGTLVRVGESLARVVEADVGRDSEGYLVSKVKFETGPRPGSVHTWKNFALRLDVPQEPAAEKPISDAAKRLVGALPPSKKPAAAPKPRDRFFEELRKEWGEPDRFRHFEFYGGVKAGFRGGDSDSVVVLDVIYNPEKRGLGDASTALRRITELADRTGVTLELEAAPYQNTVPKVKPGLKGPELVAWYGRHGFVQTAAGNALHGPEMRREPQVAKAASEKATVGPLTDMDEYIWRDARVLANEVAADPEREDGSEPVDELMGPDGEVRSTDPADLRTIIEQLRAFIENENWPPGTSEEKVMRYTTAAQVLIRRVEDLFPKGAKKATVTALKSVDPESLANGVPGTTKPAPKAKPDLLDPDKDRAPLRREAAKRINQILEHQEREADRNPPLARKREAKLGASNFDTLYEHLVPRRSDESVEDHAKRQAAFVSRMRTAPIAVQYEAAVRAVKLRYGFQSIEKDSRLSMREATDVLLDAYNNLETMAAISGLPLRAMSLNPVGKTLEADGRQGLNLHLAQTLGNAGTSGMFSWKFNKGFRVSTLALARRNDAFAHEWAHGLDLFLLMRYFAKKKLGVTGAFTWGGNSLEPLPEPLRDAFRGVMEAMLVKDPGTAEHVMEATAEAAVVKSRLDALGKKLAVHRKVVAEEKDRRKRAEALIREAEKAEAQGDNFRAASLRRSAKVLIDNLEAKKAALPGLEAQRNALTDRLAQLSAHVRKLLAKGASDYWTGAQYLDQLAGSPYFSVPAEMFARAWESYVGNRVGQQIGVEVLSGTPRFYNQNSSSMMQLAYPNEEDRERIFRALDGLMAAVATEQYFGDEAPPAFKREDNITRIDKELYLQARTNPQASAIQTVLQSVARDMGAIRTVASKLKHAGAIMANPKAPAADFVHAAGEAYSALAQATIYSARGTLLGVAEKYRRVPEVYREVRKLIGKVATDPGSGQFQPETMESETTRHVYADTSRLSRIAEKYGLDHNDAEQMAQLAAILTDYKPLRVQQARQALAKWTDYARRTKQAAPDQYPRAKALLEKAEERLQAALDLEPVKAPANVHEAARHIRALLDEVYTRQREAGIPVGYTAAGYLPRMVDEEYRDAHLTDFQKAATEVYKVQAEEEIAELQLKILRVEEKRAEAKGRMKAGLRDTDQKLPAARLARYDRILAKLRGELAIARSQDHEAKADTWLFESVVPDFFKYGGATPPSTYMKHRVLPPEADKLLAPFYVQDTLLRVEQYLHAAARHGAYAKRFGYKHEKLMESRLRLIHAGMDVADLEVLDDALRVATGNYVPGMGRTLSGVANGAYVVGTAALLPKTLFAQIAEPLTVALRTGEVRAGLQAQGRIVMDLLKLGDTRDFGELMEIMGVIGSAAHDQIVANRFMLGTYGTKKADKLMTNFARVAGVYQYTQASRRAAAFLGSKYLQTWGRRILAGGEGAKAAKEEFLEMGIPAAMHEEFAQWVNSFPQGYPDLQAWLAADNRKLKETYAAAVNRFTDQSIQNPEAVDRARMAFNPAGRFLFSLMSWSYSFQRNILARYGKKFLRAEGATAKAQVALSFVAPFALLMAGTMASQLVRELYDDQERLKKRFTELPTWRTFTDAVDRAGGTGGFSPLYNFLTKFRFDRNLGNIFNGALAGFYLQALQDGIDAITPLNPQNSPNTNTQERKGVQALYHIGVNSTLPWLLSQAGMTGPLGWFLLTQLTSRRFSRELAEELFPKTERELALERGKERRRELTKIREEQAALREALADE